MKRNILSILIIWVIIVIAFLNIIPVKAVNNNEKPLPIWKQIGRAHV